MYRLNPRSFGRNTIQQHRTAMLTNTTPWTTDASRTAKHAMYKCHGTLLLVRALGRTQRPSSTRLMTKIGIGEFDSVNDS